MPRRTSRTASASTTSVARAMVTRVTVAVWIEVSVASSDKRVHGLAHGGVECGHVSPRARSAGRHEADMALPARRLASSSPTILDSAIASAQAPLRMAALVGADGANAVDILRSGLARSGADALLKLA